ncbi:hypothetical protein [Haladaptatus caseinilyticus]|nr:hypothetical protein [Haladaptatus caseinilyticus]
MGNVMLVAGEISPSDDEQHDQDGDMPLARDYRRTTNVTNE